MTKAWDYCAVQRLINGLGGCRDFPAFPTQAGYPGDRLSQYGFSDMSDEDGQPNKPGVYAVMCAALDLKWSETYQREVMQPPGSFHLLYIGSSKNIRKRLEWKDHPWNRAHDRFASMDRIVWVHHLLTDNYLSVEKSLIRTLRPLLNIHHRNG